MVSKFKNSILVPKAIKSAIQRLLIFFRLSSGFVIFLYSDRAQSWFLISQNSVLVPKSINSAIQSTFIFFQIELWVRYFFVFRSSSELVSKFKNSVLVQKSIESAIQRLLFFFRLSSGFVIFLFSDRAQSWFLNSKILFLWKPIQSTV